MRPQGVAPSPVFEPTPYVNNTIKMFDQLRSKLGFGVELLHDVHERVPPTQALVLAKAVEPFRLFFLEDAFAPEDVSWFQIMLQQTTTPLAMGELFVNRHEWLPLVTNRWIDFIRIHISAAGGLNMARKSPPAANFSMFARLGMDRGMSRPWGTPSICTWIWPRTILEFRSRTSFPPPCGKCFRALRKSRAATCIRMASRDWASM